MVTDNHIKCQLEKIMSGVQQVHIDRTKKLSEDCLEAFSLLTINEKVAEVLRPIFFQDFFPPTEDRIEEGKIKLEQTINGLTIKDNEKPSKKLEKVEILICSNPGCQYPKLTKAMKYCPRCRQEVNADPEDIDQDDEEIVLLQCECGKFLELDWTICPYCCEDANKAKKVKEKRGFIGTIQAIINRGNPVYQEVCVVKKNGEEDSEKVEEEPEVEEFNADIDMENIITESEEEPAEQEHACNCVAGSVIEAIEEKIENIKITILESIKKIPTINSDQINKNIDLLKETVIEMAKLNAVYETELSEIKNICSNGFETELSEVKDICNNHSIEIKTIREEQQKAASCFQTLAQHFVKKSNITSVEKKKKSITEN